MIRVPNSNPIHVPTPRRVRPLLKRIIASDLESLGPHPVIDALGELASSYRDDCTYLFYEPSSPARHAWNELLRACDREQAFRAFEAATLWGVRRGLRNGSLWLPHAEQYGGQHRLLLPALRWTAARGAFLERHHLPATADPCHVGSFDSAHQLRHGLEYAASAARR